MTMTLIERRRILNLTDAVAPRDALHERRLVVNFSDDAALILDERPTETGETWSSRRVARIARDGSNWKVFSFGSDGQAIEYSDARAIGGTFAEALEGLSDDETHVFWG